MQLSAALHAFKIPVLTHQAGSLGIELPAGYQVLHDYGIVPLTESHQFVELVGLLQLAGVDLNAQTRALRHMQPPALDGQGLLGEPLSILPNPVRIDCSHFARRGRSDMGEHRQGYIEMVV